MIHKISNKRTEIACMLASRRTFEPGCRQPDEQRQIGKPEKISEPVMAPVHGHENTQKERVEKLDGKRNHPDIGMNLGL